ncbi:hypothetical protein GCM10027418_06830 [Mariniluteicoccus endophyticus]
MSDLVLSRRSALGIGAGLGVAGVAGLTVPTAFAAPTPAADRAFTSAARRYDVPREILLAVALAETGLETPQSPSKIGANGITGLKQAAGDNSVAEAARLTRTTEDKVKTDETANIMGAAALLSQIAAQLRLSPAARRNLDAWHPVLLRYSKASTPLAGMKYADGVYDALAQGGGGAGGNLAARSTEPDRVASIAAVGGSERLAIAAAEQATNAIWVPASTSNYTVANRPSSNAIKYVVMHVTQGSYAGAISWFQNPAAQSSAHYVIRSSDGQATQMVRHKDIAWHAGSWSYNQQSIGIECEGWIDQPKWFTDAMYRSAANIVRDICKTYGIPMDRRHIVGHIEVPGATHTDPGKYFDWTKFMNMVRGTTTPPAWSQTVDNTTAGRFSASDNWGTSSYSDQKFGENYRFAQPKEISDPAWYKFAVPAAGKYRVDARYPSGTGYNSAAPYLISTTSGMKTIAVDQTTGGGAWKTLGTFALAAGDQNIVGVSRWTRSAGLILADAVRLTRVS